MVYACLIGFIGGAFPAVRAARLPVARALRELKRDHDRAAHKPADPKSSKRSGNGLSPSCGWNRATDAFIQSVQEQLARHELIKLKFAQLKEQKKELAPILAEKTSSHLVARVGNVLVLYRAQPDPAKRKVQL